MDSIEPKAEDTQTGALLLPLLCSLLAMAAALTLCSGLRAQQHPAWLVVGAGLAAFPCLPLLWHVLAGANGNDGTGLSGRSRFALRSLAVALVVFGVTFGNLGAKQLVRNLRDLTVVFRSKPAQESQPELRSVPSASRAHGLESFIPADATLVVGLADATAVEQLLGAHGVAAREQVAALATCQINFANARILIAARRGGAQMIVVRASGLADERNLYCLAGVLGADQVQIRTDGKGGSKTVVVTGLLSRPLAFRTFDESTLIATDANWGDSEGQRLFAANGAAIQGRLGESILRVDRSAPLWVASVDETPQGSWDLAIDCQQSGDLFSLRGSATPPSGDGDRAELSVRVPLAFVRALPERAVSSGIRGVVAAVLTANAGLSAAKALPPAPLPPPTPRDADAR